MPEVLEVHVDGQLELDGLDVGLLLNGRQWHIQAKAHQLKPE
jgi:hypothetical protein